MLALNKRGFLNGHTPFSALVAFSSVLAAYVNGLDDVALSNEASANEVTVHGSDVNHQYSKSFEFEQDFAAYEQQFLGTGVRYFSLLRPLAEVKIAQLFARHKQYYPVFQSCNIGSKTDSWCASCAKCLFVYAILAPFVPEDELVGILGRNLLDAPELGELFDQLIGLRPEKPFECVGSCDEMCAALRVVLAQYRAQQKPLPALLARFERIDLPAGEPLDALLNRLYPDHAVPAEYFHLLQERTAE
ncbi:MAG: hypothetical protein QM689_09300 [Oscillospiraceae bacterium]